ncbi:jg23112, partial [Pararge aegeria aegeria]
SAPMALHASKKANKKSDMRVSCEAIPEEMCGTSPQPAPPHPHLMTYKSDPGTSGAESESETNAESNNPSAISAHHQLQKVFAILHFLSNMLRILYWPNTREQRPAKVLCLSYL